MKVVKVFPQKCVFERIGERIVDVWVPRILEEFVEVILLGEEGGVKTELSRASLKRPLILKILNSRCPFHRSGYTFVRWRRSLTLQFIRFRKIVGVAKVIPQEGVQQRTVERNVDVRMSQSVRDFVEVVRSISLERVRSEVLSRVSMGHAYKTFRW